jgi:HK97 family phage prohead protease
MLWQHDAGEPIGVWETVEEDSAGLHVSGRLLQEVRRGAEAAALLRAGAIDGLSIGYQTRKATRLPGGRRRLIEVDLWEVSLVTFPMLPEARAATAGGPWGRRGRRRPRSGPSGGRRTLRPRRSLTPNFFISRVFQ